jgi:hypothetical protein
MNIKMLKMAFAGLVLTVSGFSNAALIEIDISDLSAVTFTATSESSSIAFREEAGYGFSLVDFFTDINPSLIIVNDVSSTFSNVVNGQLFNRFRIRANNTSELNISGEGPIYSMLTTGAAFIGVMTLDLSDYSGRMRGVGATGNIASDYTPFLRDTFGTWEIVDVPEPSTLAIFALGLMGLASRRFMKKS